MARKAWTQQTVEEHNATMPATGQGRGAGRARAAARPTAKHQAAAQELALADVRSSSLNTRRKLAQIDELAASLAAHGLLQPIVVCQVGGEFEVVAGHRRLAAARSLGWQSIPAIVRSSNDDAYLLTLVENLQRMDLTPREEADALAVLVRQRGWSTRQVAAAIQRSQALVSKRLRVFEDPMLAPAVLANELSISAAEELLSVPERQRYEILARAIAERWDRAQVRRASQARPTADPRPPKGLPRRLRELRHDLRDVRLEDLSEADRRELRLLFADLAVLARAKPGAMRVFPPLPSISKTKRR
jgi:ParB family transcriptional regulator, chromosome partitioning protein